MRAFGRSRPGHVTAPTCLLFISYLFRCPMDVINTGNVGIRRQHTYADDVVDMSGKTTYTSDPIPLNNCTSGLFTLYWSGFNDIDAVAHIEGSYEGSSWNTIDGNGALLSSAEDTQLWDILYTKMLYIRLSITLNSVTSGVVAFKFRGEFGDAKNY